MFEELFLFEWIRIYVDYIKSYFNRNTLLTLLFKSEIFSEMSTLMISSKKEQGSWVY